MTRIVKPIILPVLTDTDGMNSNIQVTWLMHIMLDIQYELHKLPTVRQISPNSTHTQDPQL